MKHKESIHQPIVNNGAREDHCWVRGSFKWRIFIRDMLERIVLSEKKIVFSVFIHLYLTNFKMLCKQTNNDRPRNNPIIIINKMVYFLSHFIQKPFYFIESNGCKCSARRSRNESMRKKNELNCRQTFLWNSNQKSERIRIKLSMKRKQWRIFDAVN